MPIDNEKFRSPATRGDVGGVALDCAIALDNIAQALDDLKNNRNPDQAIVVIRDLAKSLDTRFETLTGWTS